MRVLNTHSSPNFSPDLIPVEFVILHYPAGDLERTMSIFSSTERGVCTHFVLDTDGSIYDLGGFLNGPIQQGAHAGVSRLTMDGVERSAFNHMSIGIEIVNLNGNLMPYTENQYDALNELLRHLIVRFPVLKKPGHILGHEHISGFRGKCDPGVMFDWERVLNNLNLPLMPVHKQTVFTKEDQAFADEYLRQNPKPGPAEWSYLSSQLEERIRQRSSLLSITGPQ